ncbi:SgrR family transcriptional regulator [Vibrio makurazakiensis]|uniref:SgrR family transcriptional regulator n=1 Tax=Vibrio makurazakiensis TaxID=2910250 RepID=UPI003D11E3F1
MHYWKALFFLRSRLTINKPTHLALDELTEALGCTRRNAQLVIKKLVKEGWIEWESGVGRGNLPKVALLQNLDGILQKRTDELLSQHKVEQALELIEPNKRDLFLLGYIGRYQDSPDTLDILQIPFYRGTHCLDPIHISRRTESHIASYLYSNLLRFDTKSNTFQGDLAIHWYQQGNTWYFTLRKDLVFHDGSPLNSHDVIKHFERLINEDHQMSLQYHCISQFNIIDDLRFSIEMKSTASYLETLLTGTSSGIAKVADGKVIGSGSFELSEQNEWLTRLTVFKHYHGLRPWIDGVEMWNIGDQAKSFDLHCDIVHAHQHYQKSEDRNFQESEQWEKGCEYALLNPNKQAWLGSLNNRQQLSVLLQLLGTPKSISTDEIGLATSMLSSPEGQPSTVNNSQKIYQFSRNLEKPKHTIKILTYQLFDHIKMAKFYCEELNKLGFHSEYQVLEFPDFCLEENLTQADIIITGEVFSDNLDSSWMGWLQANITLEVCLPTELKAWRDQQIENLWKLKDPTLRQQAFLEIEAQLINFGIYRPIFHVKQQLNQADTVNPMDLLANGWIDFNQVTMRR